MARVKMHVMDYTKIITIDPDKRSGKPCIRGTRMAVTDVLEYLAGGMTPEELLVALREASGFDASVRAAGADPAKTSLPAQLDLWFPYSVTEAPAPGGDYQASLKERLFMNNGTRIRELIQPRKGNLADWLATAAAPVEERVDRLFLTVLTRLPNPEERRLFAEYLDSDSQKRAALAEEAVWALINGSEFRFNH